VTTHTPGPWRIAPKYLYGSDGIHIDAGARSYIAHIGNHGDEQAEADARLIAAAPRLLAALEMVKELPGFEPGEPYGVATIAAIVEAKGQP